jgi:rubrerythrin
MLSKEDYKEYLNQMLEIEKNMEKVYGDLAKKIKDKEMKNIFINIKNDEHNHAQLVHKMKKLIMEEKGEF